MMTEKQSLAYGTWPSPITVDGVASSSRGLSQVKCVDGVVYWLERRPEEAGRQVIVRCLPNGESNVITPDGFNVRNRVHEYGGGDYTVHEDCVYFSNDNDQRLYRQKMGEAPVAITPEPDEAMALRYAGGVVTPNGQVLICVRESHENNIVMNALVAVPTDGSGEVRIIGSGCDFYAFPRISLDGKRLAWICWNHPAMPWDGNELWVADLVIDGMVNNARCVAGGHEESVYQPSWNANNELYFVSDRSGWWNIYKWVDDKAVAVFPVKAECGYPMWIFGTNTYAFVGDDALVAAVNHQGRQEVGLIQEGKFDRFDLPYDDIAPYITVDENNNVLLIAANAATAPAVIRYDPIKKKADILGKSTSTVIDKKYISIPEVIEFPTDNRKTAHAFYYPPHNEDCQAPADERPPLLVLSHGGPTSSTSTALNLKIQYWTSRGFAVVDVNYGGSTGYGRNYRERLKGQWGIVDVADCVNAAKYLVAQDKVDPKRMAIRGGSAGGYTTLAALVFYDVFSAGASYYGVADLKGLVDDTHKFESRYLDSLLGPYPREKAMYDERSPINHPDKITCPIIFLQGLEDKVVPPAQAETMIAALNSKGLPHAYVTFAHEQHGFRDAANIKASLEAEYYFYAQIFGFSPADDLPEIEICHW